MWPVPALPLPSGLIQEAKTYCFELRNIADPSSAELLIDDQPLKALRNPDELTAKWEWSPQFYAGQIRARIRYDLAADFEVNLTVDADLAKLSRTEFNTMLREILEDTTALFSLSGFRFGVARGAGTSVPPIARLEFLRSRITELHRVIAEIDCKPVRALSREELVRPLRSAGRITGRELYRSFMKHRLQPVPEGFTIGTRLVPAVPSRFTVSSKTATTDIAENRAIKTCLAIWRSWLSTIAERLGGGLNNLDEKQIRERHLWARRCNALAKRLARMLEMPVFADVSDQRTPLLVSPIFTRVPAYIRFFSLYRDISLGMAQVEGDFLNLPLSRTFDLYELWVFLRLCHAVAQRFGATVQINSFFAEDSSRLGIAKLIASPSITIIPGLTLQFKRQYREYWRDASRVGSFTRTMIPDISVERSATATEMVVLDAKYRVGTQLNDAISSIHTYRDAIVREVGSTTHKTVLASYLITPEMFSVTGDWQDAEMPARLFFPDYRGKFKFGAVTLRPGKPISDAIQALELILTDAGMSSVLRAAE
ncbi:MAG TPA: DUF2357 domain-containing protein [Candidatus Angelobacter sp.]|nr:DUF2357 domain-containing protein [Candidatus Angelobacter sp.]